MKQKKKVKNQQWGLLKMIKIDLMRNPLPNETVIVRMTKDTYDFEMISNLMDIIKQAFPNNNVLLLPDSIESIESR